MKPERKAELRGWAASPARGAATRANGVETLDALDAAERRATAYEARAAKLEADLAAAREEAADARRLRSEVERLDGVSKALAASHASLRAEVDAMRPVVEAAQCFRGLYRERNYEPSDFWELEGRLRAAVDAYEAAKGGGS